MIEHHKNYSVENIGPLEDLSKLDFMGFHGKYFVGKELGLTGCEVSLNRLPAGKGMPFVHTHKKNEELYIVLRGSGIFYVDGVEFPIHEGSLIRVDLEGERAWKAGDESSATLWMNSAMSAVWIFRLVLWKASLGLALP